jgi:hypothetical protein
MGDLNQLRFGMMHRRLFHAPCLEIGSREYGHTVSFKQEFTTRPGDYLGVDLEPGPGVDVALDLTADFSLVSSRLPTPFATILCLSVLEHCRQPFLMAENIQRLLAPGGALYVSVPFVWEIHSYPSDYWRFTPAAVRLLFPEVEFSPGCCAYHSQEEDFFSPLENGPPRLELLFREACARHGRLQALVFVAAKKIGIFRRSLRHSYLLQPVMIDMIGRKKEKG